MASARPGVEPVVCQVAASATTVCWDRCPCRVVVVAIEATGGQGQAQGQAHQGDFAHGRFPRGYRHAGPACGPTRTSFLFIVPGRFRRALRIYLWVLQVRRVRIETQVLLGACVLGRMRALPWIGALVWLFHDAVSRECSQKNPPAPGSLIHPPLRRTAEPVRMNFAFPRDFPCIGLHHNPPLQESTQ